MTTSIFPTVWYLPHENRWRDLNILAFKDPGKLTVGESSIEFQGAKQTSSFQISGVPHSESRAEIS
jgi:hypothetical protein